MYFCLNLFSSFTLVQLAKAQPVSKMNVGMLNVTRFNSLVSFYATQKHQKVSGFLMYSGGIERKH